MTQHGGYKPRAGDHPPLLFLHTRAGWATLSPTVSTVQVGTLLPLVPRTYTKSKK